MQSLERKKLKYIKITSIALIHLKEYIRTVEDSCLFTLSRIVTSQQHLSGFLNLIFLILNTKRQKISYVKHFNYHMNQIYFICITNRK